MQIIIGLSGGLGNQLFQYALGKSFQSKGIKVKYDTSFFDGFRSYKLDFLARDVELINLKDYPLPISFYLKYRRTKGLTKIIRFIYSYLSDYLIIENKEPDVDERIFKLSDTHFLEGHWARLAYFEDLKEELQSSISLQSDYYSRTFEDYMEEILRAKENSISIHIRRMDYLKPESSLTFTNITEGDYYSRAIEYMKTKVLKPNFFIFSDDVKWCQENLNIEGATYILPGEDMKDYHDFELIKHCRHHINANSTFSWWAAYLNTNSSKIVTVPKKWFNDKHFQKRYEDGLITPKEWIMI